MNIKKAYHYLFYKLYRFGESVTEQPWWSDWKASATLDLIIILTLLSIRNYYAVFINPNIGIPHKISILIVVLIICFFNYILFHSKQQWKKIVKDFDEKPPINSLLGTFYVLIFFILVFGNLILSFYLLSNLR